MPHRMYKYQPSMLLQYKLFFQVSQQRKHGSAMGFSSANLGSLAPRLPPGCSSNKGALKPMNGALALARFAKVRSALSEGTDGKVDVLYSRHRKERQVGAVAAGGPLSPPCLFVPLSRAGSATGPARPPAPPRTRTARRSPLRSCRLRATLPSYGSRALALDRAIGSPT